MKIHITTHIFAPKYPISDEEFEYFVQKFQTSKWDD